MRSLSPVLIFLLMASTLLIAGEKNQVNQTRKGIAVKGYDVVAYFRLSSPTPGSTEFSFDYNGATWLFASAKNLELFKENPAKYAPQYGGYCAWAVSQDSLAGIDPAAWKIVEGRLYLNYSAKIQKKWSKDIPEYIRLANEHWPTVLSQ